MTMDGVVNVTIAVGVSRMADRKVLLAVPRLSSYALHFSAFLVSDSVWEPDPLAHGPLLHDSRPPHIVPLTWTMSATSGFVATVREQ